MDSVFGNYWSIVGIGIVVGVGWVMTRRKKAPEAKSGGHATDPTPWTKGAGPGNVDQGNDGD